VGAEQDDQLEDQQDDEQREDNPADVSAVDSTAALGEVDSGGDPGHNGIVSTVRARRRATWLAAAVLAVIVAVLAIVLTTRTQGAERRQNEVKDTAKRFAVALAAYDYRHLDRDLSTVRSMGVGNFQYQYQGILGANSFSTQVVTNQTVATAKVKDGPFVAALSSDDARTFTVVSQTINGKSSPQGQTRNLRIESTLVRTSKGWRVDGVQIS
jgi:hypothetical protein